MFLKTQVVHLFLYSQTSNFVYKLLQGLMQLVSGKEKFKTIIKTLINIFKSFVFDINVNLLSLED